MQEKTERESEWWSSGSPCREDPQKTTELEYTDQRSSINKEVYSLLKVFSASDQGPQYPEAFSWQYPWHAHPTEQQSPDR
jgi:hypothetical protein